MFSVIHRELVGSAGGLYIEHRNSEGRELYIEHRDSEGESYI